MNRTNFLGLLLAAIGLAGLGCKEPAGGSGATGPGAGGDIIVGEFASLTGKEAAFGQSSHKGTLLAIEELNKAGGVLGRQLKLITEDTQSKAGESSTGVRKLISRDGAIAILGEVASSRSMEAASVCQQNKIPMISPSSTNPKVTETGDYIFRVCFIDPFQGTVMANFSKNTLKISQVAVLIDVASAYSVGLADFYKSQWAKLGGQIVSEQKYTGGDKDFRAQLTAIKSANPQGIFIPGYYNDVGLIVSQARQLGINVPIYGGDGWEAPQLLEVGKEAMEGTYYSTHFSPEAKAPEVTAFVEKYKARWDGEVPDAMAALGYDSALVLADAIKRAGTTEAAKLREAIAATRDFLGATGKTTLDAERNSTKPAVIIAVKNGKFEFLETITP